MSRAALLAGLCAALGGCFIYRAGPPVPSGSAVAFQKQVFKLSRTPDPELESALEGMLSASYDASVKAYAGDNPLGMGFSYSLTPHGAAFPFSEIEVSCLVQAKYSRSRGPELCGYFFNDLGRRIKAALAARQQE